MAPFRDIKFGPIAGNTGGWNVISSSETSDDGKARTEKMLATTEGVSAVDGGKKAFSGQNEELKTERFDGDANNFTYSTGESSNMLLNENIVTGDENSKRIESKSSSVSHTSKVIRSSTSTGDVIAHDDLQKELLHDHDLKVSSSNATNSSTSKSHVEHQKLSSDHKSSTESRNENVKLSQDSSTVREAFRLAQQPGNIISRQVERANPTTNMITEKKELLDGTIVTTKRYETINADRVDIQATTRDDRSSSINTNNSNVKTHEVNKSSQNTETSFKTSRDEEAFKLSQQPGNVISRNIEMTNPTTRMITEKKELADGTIVTTKRYETVTSSSDHSSNKNIIRDTQSTKNISSNDSKSNTSTSTSQKSSTNETFQTTRDEEAFRLAQQPGKIISRDVQLTNPTTRMITEKKELTDGTIVTTKRYESINSDAQSNKSFTKEQHNIDIQSKNLRNDSKTEEIKRTSQSVNQTFKTARDEEAFRLAEQPGTVISRNVEMANPTTRMITEKKELVDGTIVTTKRYETVNDKNESISKNNINRENIETQNVKKYVSTSNTDVKKSTIDATDKNMQREVVEETVTKKNFDTSCHCPEMHDKTHSNDFISKERNDNKYDVTMDIITSADERVQTRKQDFTELEKNREEIVRREEIRKLEQKRVDEQVRRNRDEQVTQKITRELELDSAHKAFVSSLRCVTPPNERVATPSGPRNGRRSPSRDSTTSKISSSTTSIKKSSNTDIRVKSSSPEKQPKKVSPDARKSTTEIIETIEIDSKNKQGSVTPQKFTQRTPSPSKTPQKVQQTSEKQTSSPRDVSPQKQTPKPNAPRDTSPAKSQPGSNVSTPRATSPQKSFPKSGSSTPRAVSPQKYPTNKATPHEVSPVKPSSTTKTTKRDKEIFSSTIVIDNKDKSFKDDLKIIQTIDSKDMSATTSVSDLEFVIPDRIITDLDSEDNIQIKIDLHNLNLSETDDVQIKTTIHEVSDDTKKSTKKPDDKDKKPFNRSETFEERARKLIGVSPDGAPDDNLPHYAKPTFASFPNGSINRVSEIRERKAMIEKETQEIEKVTKRKSITSETEDFIAREKAESRRRSTQAFSSPDQSPTRSNAKPTHKKPSENKKPYERSNDNCEKTQTNFTKTVKTTETRHESPEKKKPAGVSTTKTSDKYSTDHSTTTSKVSSETISNRSPVRKAHETHITIAQINISPVRNTLNSKKTKSTIDSNKNVKVAPSIRLVKRPLTDVSSTEPDSEIDTDHELIRNIDKATNKTIRKKLIQSRKDSAPVTKTTVTIDKDKVSRSVSETTFKTDMSTIKKKSVTKDVSQSKESSPKKESKRPTKCVTTKTINLTNINTINSNTLDDVVIDVQQAKSSREPSPNKMIPTPVRPDEIINGHQLIYPNKVTEPDDAKKQKPKVTNIPIFEEQTQQFLGLEISEVETNQSQIILEEDETDDSEREVINSSTLEQADRKRNSIQIDPIDDESDDHAHLLSVSQKVNKFIETAEGLKKPKKSTPFKTDEVKLEDVSEPEDDSMLSVNRKVTKFSTITDETFTSEKKTIDESMTRSVDEVDENLKNDECLLSVSDKVNKFISSAEKLVSSAPQKSPELVKNAMRNSTKSSKTDDDVDENESFLLQEKISTLTREDRSDSKSTLKSASSDITLKSTEAIKRARAVFENNTAARDVKRHDDIMSRPSVWEAKRTPTAERKVLKEDVVTKTTKVHEKSPSRERQSQSPNKDYESKTPSPTSPRRGSTDRTTPSYMRDQVSTKKDLFEKRISSSKLENEMSHHKSLSPQNSVDERNRSGSEEVQLHSATRKISTDKHYMSHTVASLEHVSNERRDHELSRTSRRDSDTRRDSASRSPTKFHRNISESTNDSTALESPRTPTKFGVELKRTDSGKNVQPRRVSAGGETINVEEIFDLAELEKLLEIVVGYEQRRKIRSQIRLVRKMISERKSSVETKTTRNERVINSSSNYTSPSRKPRDESVTQTKVSPRTVVEKPDSRVQKVVTTTTTTTTTKQSSVDKPREVVQTRTTRITTDKPSTPRGIIENLNKNSRIKTAESVVKIAKKTSATSSTLKANTTRESRTDSDCVTSSYGVGPTDSNGLPLFGLKALKKKGPITTKESKSKLDKIIQ